MAWPSGTCCWLPVAGLVVGLAHTVAGAPIFSSDVSRNWRRFHQFLIGRKAARPMMRTATMTHTATIGRPRRRSALFCWARICSTTAWLSLLVVLVLATSGGPWCGGVLVD